MTKKELRQTVDKLEELKAAFEFKLEEIDDRAENRASGERTEREEEKAEELENTINLIDELIEDLENTYL